MASRAKKAADEEEESAPDADPRWVAAVREGLANWYERGHRDLPWRRERDPYRILVSETMLVQTTVAAATPYYERFLARFPSVGDLAAADEAEVLKAWEGLGYYRRARQLHAAARAIVHEHGGSVPESVETLQTLPGVGRYIAGAVASFAFDQPAPIVEANSQRVLARLLAWDQPMTTSASRARLWRAAEHLVPADRPGRFNQALMELGATVCTPREPRCLLCPLANLCRARARGVQERVPAQSPRPAPLAVSEACVIVERDGDLLVARRASGGLWAGFWEFPTIHVAGADPANRHLDDDPSSNLSDALARLTGISARIGPPARTIRFGVTKHRVELAAHPAIWLDGQPRSGPGLERVCWMRPEELAALPFGSAQRTLADWAADQVREGCWAERCGDPAGSLGS